MRGMRAMTRAWIPAAAVALLAEVASAGSIEIRHDPASCVTVDRYPRVSATAVPPEQVASAELQFRGNAAGGWYSVRMAAEGGVWSGVLPRPIRTLERFEYRIVMVGTDLATAETAAFAVRVADDPAPCAGGPHSSVAVAAPIVVRVPAGAPLVPPVPPGFSPAGVVAAAEPATKSGSTKKWVALAGVAGGVAAAAMAAGAASQPRPLPAGVPDIEFFGSSPNPGSVLSLSRDRLSVSVRITGQSRFSLDLLWRIDLLGGTGESACAVMFGRRTINALRPQVVDLTSGLVPSGSCGSRFDVAAARLSILIEGQVAYDQTLVLPYHFEP